jgi:hypothetical protein
MDKLRDELNSLLPERPTVYTDLPTYGHDSPSSSGLDWLKRTNAFIPFASYQDVKPVVGALRTFKDGREIELIRKATDATVAAHMAAMKTIKPRVTERELSALLQYEWGKRGCERPSYAPIVGSGFNSTVLHYSEDSATVQDGDVIVIDAAGEYSMYATDITRTYPANGKFTAQRVKSTTSCWALSRQQLRRSSPANLRCAAKCEQPVQGGLRLHQHAWQTCTANRLGNTSFMDWATMSAWPSTIPEIIRFRRTGRRVHARTRHYIPESWARGLKTRSTWMRTENWSIWERPCPTRPTKWSMPWRESSAPENLYSREFPGRFDILACRADDLVVHHPGF